jgi:predicted DNA-binding ribbon-helix-helix protein
MMASFEKKDSKSALIGDLYEKDFVLWTNEIAQVLREKRFNDLDINNLIDEVEDLGRVQKQALRSNLRVLLMHLLKYEYQLDHRSSSWKGTIREHRARINDLINDSPSLKNDLADAIGGCYQIARTTASEETRLKIKTFPEDCPYSQEQIQDFDFWPGLTDDFEDLHY